MEIVGKMSSSVVVRTVTPNRNAVLISLLIP